MPKIRVSCRILSSERSILSSSVVIALKMLPSLMAFSKITDTLATAFLAVATLFIAFEAVSGVATVANAFGLSIFIVCNTRLAFDFKSFKLLCENALRTGWELVIGDRGIRLTGDVFRPVENIWHIPWKLYASSFDTSAVTFMPASTKSCTNIVHFCQFDGFEVIPSRKLKSPLDYCKQMLKIRAGKNQLSERKLNLPLLIWREMFLLTSQSLLLPTANRCANQMIVDFIPSAIEMKEIGQHVIQFGIGSSRIVVHCVCHFCFTGHQNATGSRQSVVHLQKEYHKHSNGVRVELKCCAIARKCAHHILPALDISNQMAA